MRAGEWWRMVTPLFVQPSGWVQCLTNGMFAVVFLPVAEKVYGRGLLALYFIPGLLCQAVNYLWNPNGGGSSTGIFGVIGGLYLYILRYRRTLPVPVLALSIAGLCAGVLLCVPRDGHGPGLLIGAAVATLLPAVPPPVEDSTALQTRAHAG